MKYINTEDYIKSPLNQDQSRPILLEKEIIFYIFPKDPTDLKVSHNVDKYINVIKFNHCEENHYHDENSLS